MHLASFRTHLIKHLIFPNNILIKLGSCRNQDLLLLHLVTWNHVTQGTNAIEPICLALITTSSLCAGQRAFSLLQCFNSILNTSPLPQVLSKLSCLYFWRKFYCILLHWKHFYCASEISLLYQTSSSYLRNSANISCSFVWVTIAWWHNFPNPSVREPRKIRMELSSKSPG